MGVFSFLSDLVAEKKPETASPEAVTRAEGEGLPPVPASPAPADPVPASAPETPFTPPAAWQPEPMAQAKPAAAAPDKLVVGPLDPEKTAALQGPIIEAIKTVFDPEIPVDIYELGLIYDINVDADRNVQINMTLTSPACPSAQQLPADVHRKVRAVPDVNDVKVDIVWEPTWGKERMSEAAKLALGMF
ncbi:MAG: DUF59 domain-containing protein [Vicinamibacterales bacterium]